MLIVTEREHGDSNNDTLRLFIVTEREHGDSNGDTLRQFIVTERDSMVTAMVTL